MHSSKSHTASTRAGAFEPVEFAGSSSKPRDPFARAIHELFKDVRAPCRFIFPGGETLRIGGEEPAFTVTFNSDRAFARGVDEFALGRAYVDGDIEIEGRMARFFEIREHMTGDLTPLFLFRMWLRILFRDPIRLNRESIAHHYNFGDDFYLTFVDRDHCLYSHCLFKTGDETLEEAAENKLSLMARRLRLEPGMRLLDIGAGWGAVTRFCGPRGVRVTALTIAEDSYKLHREMIRERNLDQCRVLLEDFLAHRPAEPYDAIVIFGVIEHIPHYRRFCERAWKVLKPGGRIYLDASAVLEKYDVSNFVRHYIYPGTHSYLCLPDLVREFLMHGFNVREIVDETLDYERTLAHWAQRLEESRDTIVQRWGEKVFRIFRLYLWGGSYALRVRDLQAYHVVVERTTSPGIRPGLLKRIRSFIRGLA